MKMRQAANMYRSLLVGIACMVCMATEYTLGGTPVTRSIAADTAMDSRTASLTEGGGGLKRARSLPEFSTAGFYQTDAAVRMAASFNVGWRFHLGRRDGAETPDFDDSAWEVVNVPHGLELVPLDASGCVNYRGPAWYRKHFSLDETYRSKKVFLHFEAIMGKSKIYLNGRLLKKNTGGYLPIHVDVTEHLRFGEKNVLAVLADNSDDGSYPPGKPQGALDFTYFGGIYRDVFLITTGKTYVTNPNAVNKVAGGGVFVHIDEFSKEQVKLVVDTDIRNEEEEARKLQIRMELVGKDGKSVATSTKSLLVPAKADEKSTQSMIVTKPHLWHVNDPYLHLLNITIVDDKNGVVDAFRMKVGLRKIEFRGRKGFFLNDEPIDGKLIGGNRHQDYAYIGNALPNGTHWRDAKKLRDASMRIIRCAHYPQDPAFMDACDELGLFVIVATPGWQFWNGQPSFGQGVLADIRNMVRRDRNRPSVIMWEPILNETGYPGHFGKAMADAAKTEYPYQGCYIACDHGAGGEQHFDILYAHPFRMSEQWHKHVPVSDENRKRISHRFKDERPVFCREWGDQVDDWHSHNGPSRISKAWGEAGQIVQALHYGQPAYLFSSYDAMCYLPEQFIGGALWHPFDHQRGYHPDPFYGGILDAFRQPKYSYYLFRSQTPVGLTIDNVESRPFVFIAHEMTPISGRDVVVFSNCETVRLRIGGQIVGPVRTHPSGTYMPHAPVIFKDVYRFKRWDSTPMIAEGLIQGKVAATHERKPAKRRCKISLKADFSGAALSADGGDLIPVVATLTDQHGTPKRLTDEYIRFEVEGEGLLVDDGRIAANPQKAEWGEAIALVRATETAGTIVVKASVLRATGHQPKPEQIVMHSQPAAQKMIYSETPTGTRVLKGAATVTGEALTNEALQRKMQELQKELDALRLKEVERAQNKFLGE